MTFTKYLAALVVVLFLTFSHNSFAEEFKPKLALSTEVGDDSSIYGGNLCEFKGYHNIANEYHDRKFIPKIINILLPEAEKGDTEAEYNLGVAYAYAYKYEKALPWFLKAAKKGFVKSQYNLGIMYAKTNNTKEAIKWWHKTIEQGYDSYGCLGWVYADGIGIPKNYKEAAKWIKKAAEMENEVAQFRLGAMYYYGLGVARSGKEALKWFRKLSKRGYTAGHSDLGVMYATGQGVNVDYRAAVGLFREGGSFAIAQYNLGVMYYYGAGVRRDKTEAWKRFKIACKNGYEGACKPYYVTTPSFWEN
ncbi:tetratricopeptide repeat protein [Avibacterium avium]|uniref:tetratricopeptide repeat protein n=1 Tax=Avibacterium avium TaxID=751 RepID=UPI003BF8C8E9